MTADWRDILVAYLHDPPDKALQIRGHEGRARRYLRVALGDQVSEAELKDPSDSLAAIAERVPSPRWETLTVGKAQDCFTIRHPLSAAEKSVPVAQWNESAVAGTIAELVAPLEDTKSRFLLLWRQLATHPGDQHGKWFAGDGDKSNISPFVIGLIPSPIDADHAELDDAVHHHAVDVWDDDWKAESPPSSSCRIRRCFECC